MPKCPKCNNIISELEYITYDKGNGKLNLSSHFDFSTLQDEYIVKIDRPKKTTRSTYVYCSACKKPIFFNLIKAAKFLTTGVYEKEDLPDKFWSN